MNASATLPTILPTRDGTSSIDDELGPPLLDSELVAAQALRLVEVWTVPRGSSEAPDGGPADADEIMVGVAVDTVVLAHKLARERLEQQ